MKEKDLKTLKILNWLNKYYLEQNTVISLKTIKEKLLVGTIKYSDHTTISNWLIIIRENWLINEPANGIFPINIEQIQIDGEQLTTKRNESIDKRNRMLQQWVKDSKSNSESNSESNNKSTNELTNQILTN